MLERERCIYFLKSMLSAYASAWKRSFEYGGRSSRSEFWWFYLANIIGAIILLVIAQASDVLYAFYFLYIFGQIFLSLSVMVRRLRDAGKEWAWIFISLVPFIGGIWLLVLLAQPSLPA